MYTLKMLSNSSFCMIEALMDSWYTMRKRRERREDDFSY